MQRDFSGGGGNPTCSMPGTGGSAHDCNSRTVAAIATSTYVLITDFVTREHSFDRSTATVSPSKALISYLTVRGFDLHKLFMPPQVIAQKTRFLKKKVYIQRHCCTERLQNSYCRSVEVWRVFKPLEVRNIVPDTTTAHKCCTLSAYSNVYTNACLVFETC